MEDQNYSHSYRTELKFIDKYFPKDRLGTSGKMIFRRLMEKHYKILKGFEEQQGVENKFFRHDLMRYACEEMELFGFKPRKFQ